MTYNDFKTMAGEKIDLSRRGAVTITEFRPGDADPEEVAHGLESFYDSVQVYPVPDRFGLTGIFRASGIPNDRKILEARTRP